MYNEFKYALFEYNYNNCSIFNLHGRKDGDIMSKKGEACDFMLIKEDTLKALYSSDLLNFLEKANLRERFEKGLIDCKYCNSTISVSNLYAFIPNKDHFDICCTKSECIIALSQEAML